MVDINSPREEIVAAWLARLRDPNSKQAFGKLRDGDSRCCLGHLCDALGIEPQWGVKTWKYLGQSKYLPEIVARAVGLTTEDGQYGEGLALTTDNDGYGYLDKDCKTLPEIADIIERRPPGLFVEEERT